MPGLPAWLHYNDRRPVIQYDRKTDRLLRDAGGARLSMRLLRVDIDENRQWIIEGFADFPKAFECMLDIGRFALDLDRDDEARSGPKIAKFNCAKSRGGFR